MFEERSTACGATFRKIIAVQRNVQTPTGTSTPVDPAHGLRDPLASGTPVGHPDQPRFLVPPLFSTISCANRCNVRSISGADTIGSFRDAHGYAVSHS